MPDPNDNQQVYYTYNGNILHNIMNVRIDPEGGESTIRRGITPTKRALGRRFGQLPHYRISFDCDLVKNMYPDWLNLSFTKDKFIFAEIGDDFHHNFQECVVESASKAPDENGNVTVSVSLTALYDKYVV
jgi:hypothetical protein